MAWRKWRTIYISKSYPISIYFIALKVDLLSSFSFEAQASAQNWDAKERNGNHFWCVFFGSFVHCNIQSLIVCSMAANANIKAQPLSCSVHLLYQIPSGWKWMNQGVRMDIMYTYILLHAYPHPLQCANKSCDFYHLSLIVAIPPHFFSLQLHLFHSFAGLSVRLPFQRHSRSISILPASLPFSVALSVSVSVSGKRMRWAV